jgi:hypothetical protein
MELEFVQKILDNPDKIQEIIETSEFYDKEVLNMGGNTYKSLMEYITRGNENAEISNFGRITITDGKGGIKFDNVKAVHIFNTSQLKIIFIFIESDGKSILAEISNSRI